MVDVLLLTMLACGPDNLSPGRPAPGDATEDPTSTLDSVTPPTDPTTPYGTSPTVPTSTPTDSGTTGTTTAPLSCGTLDWVIGLGGTVDDVAYDVDVAPDGTLVVTGGYSGALTFDAGEPTEIILVSPCGGSDDDVFVAKLALDGTVIWAKRAGGCGTDRAYSVDVAADGSIAIGGDFYDNATFGPGEGNETVLDNVGATDAFTAVYEADGTLRWAAAAGGWNTVEEVRDVDIAADGSVWVTGTFSEELTFGAGSPTEVTLNCWETQIWDAFVGRYNADGSIAWAQCIGNGPYMPDDGEGVLALPSGDALALGQAHTEPWFDPGGPTEVQLTGMFGSGMYLARYTSAGAVVWPKQVGFGTYYAGRLDLMGSGDVAVTGTIAVDTVLDPGTPQETTLVFDPPFGNMEVWVGRYTQDGILVWAKDVVAVDSMRAKDVDAGPEDRIAIAGYLTNGDVTFGAGEPTEVTLDQTDTYDAFAATWDADGDFECAWIANGTDEQRAEGVAVDLDGGVIVVGSYKGTVTFAAGTPEAVAFTAAGDATNEDLFIARYHPSTP